jgi:polyhydroxyalkanoic acid synthase PhaR subunit
MSAKYKTTNKLIIQIIGGKNMAPNFNFYEMWKEHYSQYSNLFDDQITKQFPAQAVGQMLEMNVQIKKMLNETTERYYEFVNLPSRNDLAHISSQIVNIDAKVDDLEEFIQESKDNQRDPVELQREITNLKKDMKSFDTKLNQILTLLNSQKVTNTKGSV